MQLAGTVVSGDTTGVTMGASSIFQLNNANGHLTDGTVMLLGGSTGQTVGQISSGIGFSRENVNDWGTQLRFYTHNSATDVLSTLKERMRINSAGNLGIGETNPSYRLDVKTPANNIASFESQASSYPSSVIYNAVIGRGTNIIAPSTTTTIARGYGGAIALIVMRNVAGVADTQNTYLVTWGWNTASLLYSNSYGTNATAITFTASASDLQVTHTHSGNCTFILSSLINGEL